MPTAAYAQYGEDPKAHRGGRILTTTLLPARRPAQTAAGSRRSRVDYREALEFYEGALHDVVRGGDHTLVSFPERIPELVDWAAS